MLDDKDIWIYLRKRLRELNLKYFVRAANVTKFLDDLLDFLRRCQDELVGPEKYASYVGRLARGELPVPRVCKTKDANLLSDEEVLGRCQEIADVFTTVERMLGEENLGTFGHMITRAHQLLGQDEALLNREREHARFILVDEFQDANFAQVKILQKLAGEDSKRIRSRRSGSGHLSFSGCIECCIRPFSAPVSRCKISGAGKEPALHDADLALRLCPDFEKPGHFSGK